MYKIESIKHFLPQISHLHLQFSRYHVWRFCSVFLLQKMRKFSTRCCCQCLNALLLLAIVFTISALVALQISETIFLHKPKSTKNNLTHIPRHIPGDNKTNFTLERNLCRLKILHSRWIFQFLIISVDAWTLLKTIWKYLVFQRIFIYFQ